MSAHAGLKWVLLALLCFFITMPVHQAHAQTDATATMCDDGSWDRDHANSRNSFEQDISTLMKNINTLFPVAPALSQCVQNIMNVFQRLPGLADPLGIARAIIDPLIQSIIGQVCSQVMGTITSAQSAVGNLAKICLPTLQFGGLDLPSFNIQSCSGGTVINPLTSFSSPPITTYNYRQFQGQP